MLIAIASSHTKFSFTLLRTISSGIHMSQVLSAKRVNGSTILGSVEQPISPGTLVLQLTSLRLDLF